MITAVLAHARSHTVRAAGRALGILPMQRVVRGLRRRGVALERLDALEVFAYTGERLTRHYAPHVASLEAWEIDPACEHALRRNLPRAEIRILDSFEEIRRTDRRYGLVVVDNPVWFREHFELFPHAFRVLADNAVLVLLVLPELDETTERQYPELFDERHVDRRRAFYETDDPRRVPLEMMVAHYGRLAAESGFALEWSFAEQRRELQGLRPRRMSMFYLVLKLARSGNSTDAERRLAP
jgi:hypothetical protein